MVIIHTNDNNPATLKLLVGANFAQSNVEVKTSRPCGSLKCLPQLETDEGVVFFLPNAAVCHFLPPKASKVYDWLEWEAVALAPTLAKSLDVSELIGYLNKELEGNKYLVGGTVSAADVSIWSTLYPMFKSPPFAQLLSDKTNVKHWFDSLSTLKPFQDALSAFTIDPSSSYAALSNASRYLIGDKSAVKKTDKTSPQHSIEEVTKEELQSAERAWQKTHKDLPQFKRRTGKILPVPGEKNMLITSALPYVNNVPHLGNIIGCVLSADVFARFCRSCDYNTLYVCGTDEYGTATETKALEEGLSCKEICDKYFRIHKEIYEWFGIGFDHFGRTSNPEQTDLCQEIFLQLNGNGFTFTESVEQLHCGRCDRYLADRFVEGGCPNVGCTYEDARGDQCDGCGKLVNAIELRNPRCKVCGDSPTLRRSEQFFIDLPKLEPLLLHWTKLSSPGWSSNAQIITRSWLREGLKPRCITRDLKWGVPVPLDNYRNKVFYVWFDAPIGYLSITKAYTEDYFKWWKPERDTAVTLYQFMAKDNVPFHAVLFPSMMLGVNKGYVTVSHIMATEYLNYEDGKFSKSRGVGVFGNDALNTGIPADVWRFYLLYVRPESQDSSFSWSDLVTKNNSELLNNLGNFVNRALMFAKNNFGKIIPEMRPNEDDLRLLALCTRELAGYLSSLEKAKLRDGIRFILAISRHGNQYMQGNQPWVLLKGSQEEKLRAGTVIGICCNLVCLLAGLLKPYMPDTAEKLKKQLNARDFVLNPQKAEIVTLLEQGHHLGDPFPLFSKIEPALIEELKGKFGGNPNQVDDKKEKVHSAPVKVEPNLFNDKLVQELEEKITKQGALVRKLKESGIEKSAWQPEVTKLLQLKKELGDATGVVPAQKNKKGKK